jgi:hypothetical protein
MGEQQLTMGMSIRNRGMISWIGLFFMEYNEDIDVPTLTPESCEVALSCSRQNISHNDGLDLPSLGTNLEERSPSDPQLPHLLCMMH